MVLSKAVLIDRFDKFVSSLSKKDRILILAHGDGDGLCSSIILAHALVQLRGRKPNEISFQGYSARTIPKDVFDLVVKKKINKVISVDWVIDQDKKVFNEFEKLLENVLILDHHKIYADLNSKKTLMIKSQWISKLDGSKYPAAKLTFDLFNSKTDLSKFDWFAGIGIIADSSQIVWSFFLKKLLKKYGLPIDKSFKKNALGDMSKMVEALMAIDPWKIYSYFKIFYLAKNPQKLLNSRLKLFKEKMEKEINYWLQRFEDEKESYDNGELLYFEFKSKYSIKSPLINKISWELYPNKTIVLVVNDSEKEFVSFSARRQDFKVKVNDLLEKSIEGLKNANAGGHIPAAAGTIRKEDLSKFKNNLIEIHSKNK